jgi:hypothetical protein
MKNLKGPGKSEKERLIEDVSVFSIIVYSVPNHKHTLLHQLHTETAMQTACKSIYRDFVSIVPMLCS